MPTSPRSTPDAVASLAMRLVLFGVAMFIAIRATSAEHADYAAIFISITFTGLALGYSIAGIARLFGRD